MHEQAREIHFTGVVFGVPTFGKVSDMFCQSLNQTTIPIFVSPAFHWVRGKPVDVARNEIADVFMRNQRGFLLFRDDDVLTAPDVLAKLLKRFPAKVRAEPSLGNSIIGGVVYVKSTPTYPMIYRTDCVGGYEDWDTEELVWADVIGMGATMIPNGVFLKLDTIIHNWQCVQRHCDARWTEVIEAEERPTCSICKQPMVREYFRTARGVQDDDSGTLSSHTEDTYFCLNAAKVGCEVYADTGVQTKHEAFDPNPTLSKYYYYNEKMAMPVMQQGNNARFYPTVSDSLKETYNRVKSPDIDLKKVDGELKFNLGCGGVLLEGYINMDKTTKCDYQCDVRKLRQPVLDYGKPMEINADHLLEHFKIGEIPGILREWVRVLAPGGVLKVEVPDGLWAAQNFITQHQNGSDPDDFPEMIVMGAQRWDGDEHRSLVTEKKLRTILDALSNMVENYTIEVVPKGAQHKSGGELNQQVLRLTVNKKAENNGDGVDKCIDNVGGHRIRGDRALQG